MCMVMEKWEVRVLDAAFCDGCCDVSSPRHLERVYIPIFSSYSASDIFPGRVS